MNELGPIGCDVFAAKKLLYLNYETGAVFTDKTDPDCLAVQKALAEHRTTSYQGSEMKGDELVEKNAAQAYQVLNKRFGGH